MKKQVKKLSLKTDTILRLSARELSSVKGGYLSDHCPPPSANCSSTCPRSVYTAFGYASGKC